MENTVNYVKVAACIASAIAIGLGTLGPSLGQGMVASKACENIGKYPENAGNIMRAMIIGLSFIETSSLYALLTVIFLIFII